MMNSEGTGRNRRVHVIVSVLTELSFIARCGRPTLPDPLPALGRYADTSSMKFCIVRILSVVSARVGIVILVAVGTLSPGCMVGPDFRLPTVPNTTEYTATPMPQETASALGTGGAMQDFLFGQEIPDQWWTLFQSKALDGVIRQAMADSPTLAAARSTLRQAQEKWRAQFGTLFPTVDVSASASREKISGAEFGEPSMIFPPFALFNASVTVSYALDFFGGTRRELETLQSQVDYQSFQLEGAYLTLTANIVTTAVREASLRSQIRATQEILAVQEKQLELVEQQLHLGGASQSDVLSQRTQVAQTRVTLPSLEKELEQTRHLMAVLVGKLPSEAAALPTFDLDGLQLPQEIPVSLPSVLVRQRPDIRASEALLHAACAQVGVATANLYPQVTLTGSYGSETNAFHDLFGSGTSIWSFGAGLLQPLFQGGELTAKRRAAIAAYDQATAQYQETVLQAFQNVADVLRALDADASALKAQSDAQDAAADTLALTQKQFHLGAVSYLSLLDAQRQYQQTRISLAQAQAARFADTAALFQALGGGWWNRAPQADTPAMTSGALYMLLAANRTDERAIRMTSSERWCLL